MISLFHHLARQSHGQDFISTCTMERYHHSNHQNSWPGLQGLDPSRFSPVLCLHLLVLVCSPGQKAGQKGSFTSVDMDDDWSHPEVTDRNLLGFHLVTTLGVGALSRLLHIWRGKQLLELGESFTVCPVGSGIHSCYSPHSAYLFDAFNFWC